jgi:hypothetical protein
MARRALSARFVADLTFPDESVVQPGLDMLKIW